MEFKAAHGQHTVGLGLTQGQPNLHEEMESTCVLSELHIQSHLTAPTAKNTTTNSLPADESVPKPWKILQIVARTS